MSDDNGFWRLHKSVFKVLQDARESECANAGIMEYTLTCSPIIKLGTAAAGDGWVVHSEAQAAA